MNIHAFLRLPSEEGRTLSLEVADKKRVQGLKAGDRVDVA
jgi:hypothetical protein